MYKKQSVQKFFLSIAKNHLACNWHKAIDIFRQEFSIPPRCYSCTCIYIHKKRPIVMQSIAHTERKRLLQMKKDIQKFRYWTARLFKRTLLPTAFLYCTVCSFINAGSVWNVIWAWILAIVLRRTLDMIVTSIDTFWKYMPSFLQFSHYPK